MRSTVRTTFLIPFLIAIALAQANSQTRCAFTHYSVEDGLSEGVVLTMHQDHEGLMWFGTFDGLNRFDGYSFKVYKSGFNSNYALKNNRVDRITEDDLGYLWIMNNDGEVYRMNTHTEEFVNFNEASSAGPETYSPVNHIYCLSKGETWLSTESGRCIRIISNALSSDYKINRFVCGDSTSFASTVNLIYKDSLRNAWILSDHGLFRIAEGEEHPGLITFGAGEKKDNRAFFCLQKFDGKIWLGSENGTLLITDSDAGRPQEISFDVRSNIVAIKPLNNREMIILTSDDGFFVYDLLTGKKKHFNKDKYSSIPSDKMVSVFIDRYGEAWIETAADGVTHYDPFSGKVRHFRMNVDKTNPNVLLPAFEIFEDRNDILWVYPRGGGFSKYNRAEKKLEYFFNEPGSPDRRFPNLIHSALSDNQGNLWMCTISRGIEKISFFPNQFRVLSPKPATSTHSENEVRAIFEDQNRYLWVATRDGLVYLFNPERNIVGHLRSNGTFTTGTSFNALVYSITQDSKGNIWLGSKGYGLFRLEPAESGLPYRYRISNFMHDPADPYSISHDNVYSVYEDHSGRIWVGTFNGGLNYIEESGNKIRFINSFNLLKKYPFANHKRVRHITSDHDNRIWIGTTSGAVILTNDFSDPSEAEFISCYFDPEDETSLAGNDIHYIYCSPGGQIYIATFGGGLNMVIKQGTATEKPAFKSFTVKKGAPDDVILSIVDDLNGNLWLSSERGILKFNRHSESFEIYSEQSGVEKRYFSEATGIRTADNDIMFGFDNGIYYFNPARVKKMNYVPAVVFTGLMVSSTDMGTNALSSSAASGRDKGDLSLELSHRQKSLSIEYAALDYRDPKNIQYAHMLEGIDTDWHIERGRRVASYTNLSPGDFTFRVRSTNADGIWVNNERAITIRVNPSFWNTAVARTLMVILTLGLIALTFYIIFTFYKLRHKVEVEQLITNLKLKFFTDVSHELRTPLTLISSPVKNILDHNEIEPEVRDQLTIVQTNTERMLRLVNQILDFRKVQSRKMHLKIEEFALGSYMKEICTDFIKIAEDKGIILEINDLSDGKKLWADRDKVEKIAFNLITNALKFTPRGKKVTVTVKNNINSIDLIVADQGIGLSKEKLKNLFSRYDSDDNETFSLQPGTGIGLALSRELAELHRARLTAESEEGKGSTFKVAFQTGFAHFDNKTEFVIADGQNPLCSENPESQLSEFDEKEDEGNTPDDEPVLLFVEDNEELRSFLKIILADGFHVIEAGNGREGFEIARNQLPDIIITDLMMPEMDGLEMARRIREDVNTSHIPVIVLTAKTDLDTQVEALKTGADDFIIKPFSSTYLRAKVESILAQRKKLQEQFMANLSEFATAKSKGLYEVNPSAPVIESHDDKLMKRLMEVMEQNIDNSELTVDELVSKIGIGRSVFFKKLKSLTGLAPIEFIREVRIKRAAQLIETGEYTISQITYMIGCNDPRYFSRIFKQRFGLTPTEFKDKHAK